MTSARSTMGRRGFLRAMAGAGLSVPALGVLSACGDGGGGGGSLGSGGSGGGDGEVSELIVPTAETPWLPSYRDIVADYEQETGVKVTLKTFPMDGLLTQQANAIQQQSDAFDVFQINERWSGQFYSNGWVQSLAEIDPDFSWESNLMRFDGVGQWDAQRAMTSPDGEPMALPINGNILLFVYRKDLYDELGLELPQTWDELVANGEQAKDAGAVEHGYVLRGKTPTFDFESVLYSYGGSWFADAEGWTPAITSPEAEEALAMFVRMAELGPAEPQTVAQAEAVSVMQSGEALQACLVVAAAAPLEDENASLTAGKLGYAVVPGGPVDQTPVSGTWTLGVPAGIPEERARAAYNFITWLTGQEAMQAWAGYGGVPTRTDVLTEETTEQRPELAAMIESDPLIRAPIRFPFQGQMLQSTERYLGEAVAKSKTVPETLAAIEQDLRRIVDEEGPDS
ncbi:extracellular solute-binding protein [Phytoactinopolyspora halotolerans]|uniref:Extracellular solute-binding protein n=1 Tax=Phytoactinopolyspora halotolerans TaxID=1981512 RepID=A0A6L9S353_9ACTN|nr:extracellular solute-binding protein [Phytoactinopolyspora halotolerans]NED99492.1 extracellular solute-binding protein [Phytoactinopolyspora halotolerans]